MTTPLNLAILISGGGSNMQALINACRTPGFPAQVALVIANRPDAGGIAKAKAAGIPAIVIDHKAHATRESFESALQTALETHPVDLICLAGFMRILTPGFVANWEGRMLNTHPALLPLHGGPGMYGEHVHNAVLAAGDAESGVSIHLVTAAVDQGPVILQKRVPVLPGDTAATLAASVLEKEHEAYPEAVRLMAARLSSPSPKGRGQG